MVDLPSLAGRVLMSAATQGRKRLSILIYHRVLPERDSMAPGIPTAGEFRWQMELMRKHFNLLSLSQAFQLLREGRLPARAACITFDDGYADNATVAHPILAELKIPMTIFVATGYLDGGRMWNDTLLEAVKRFSSEDLDLQELGFPRYTISNLVTRKQAAYDIIYRSKYLESDQRREVAEYLNKLVPGLPDNLMMTSDQVGALAQQGVEIGGHTVHHPILSRIDDTEARAEINNGRAQLENIIGYPPSMFAYPNGKPGVDYNETHVRMVKEAGFSGAVTTGWGVSGRSTDPFQLPRFTPWDKSAVRFLARMALNSRKEQ